MEGESNLVSISFFDKKACPIAIVVYLRGGNGVGVYSEASNYDQDYLQHPALFCIQTKTSHRISDYSILLYIPNNATIEIAAPRTVITSRVNQQRISVMQTGAKVHGAIAVTIPKIKIIR